MTGPTVGDLAERALIRRIGARIPAGPPWVTLGLGDDAAVLEPERNRLDVLSADVLVEGVHFERRYVPADAIGHKALAINLSDLAAMGARPRAALLSLGLPAALPLGDFDALVEALLGLAARHRVELVGGNVARSPGPLFADLTVYGSVHRRRILRRSGARPGDAVYMSGQVGAARAGFEALAAGRDDEVPACTGPFLRPEPRVRLGLLVGRSQGASAAVDLSDGLADGLRQIASAGGVGIRIDASSVPVPDQARRWFQAAGLDPVTAALSGGEDYELLFTVPPRRRRAFEAAVRLAGVPCTRIGQVIEGEALVLESPSGSAPLPDGFVHFR